MEIAIWNIQKINIMSKDRDTVRLEIEFRTADVQEFTLADYNGQRLINTFSNFVQRDNIYIQVFIKALERESYV